MDKPRSADFLIRTSILLALLILILFANREKEDMDLIKKTPVSDDTAQYDGRLIIITKQLTIFNSV
jgi:hypothetical protein